jgi:hypothetical protein
MHRLHTSCAVSLSSLQALAAVLALASTFASRLGAQEPVFIYGLNQEGRLSVNATVLDSLPSAFNPNPVFAPQQRWVDLIVGGSDRFALRRDGVVFQNGKRLHLLPFTINPGFGWVSIGVSSGTVHAIREDGLLSVGGEDVASLPLPGDDNALFFFRRLVLDGTVVYSLRADGAVFRNGTTSPHFKFEAGAGLGGFVDGRAVHTVWLALDIDPVSGDLFALRADGFVFRGFLPRGDDEDIPGEQVAELPFPSSGTFFAGELYTDIEFGADGTWYALRGNGQVFTETNQLNPIVNLPGDGASSEDLYVDVTTFGNDFWAVRGDGRVFKNIDGVEVLNLPQAFYARIAVSDEAPDLTNLKRQKPVVASFTASVLDSQELRLPVLATDVDDDAADLAVTPLEPLPPGSVFDAETRTLVWADAGPPGNHAFTVLVDDGDGPPVQARSRIRVLSPDTRPDKNRPPVPARVRNLQALVGVAFELPIFAADPDGDVVTITTDTAVYPFTAGAAFDAETGVFSWTPAFEDIGKVTVRFRVSDGTASRILNVKLSVLNPLIF